MIALYSSSYNLEFICYDDGCNLRKYARNSIHHDLITTDKLLAKTEIVIDKLHLAGHVDKWCIANCSPYLFPQLDQVCIMIHSLQPTNLILQLHY